MATIDNFKEWLKPLCRYSSSNLKVLCDSVDFSGSKYTVELYTETNMYHIRGEDRVDGTNYLGCTASARYPRPGEYWLRGSDLPDGDLSYETFQAILNSIIAYELVPPYEGKNPGFSGTFNMLARSCLGVYRLLGYIKEGFIESASEAVVIDIFGGRVIDALSSMLKGFPISYLPELLCSPDALVREAAAKVIDERGKINEE